MMEEELIYSKLDTARQISVEKGGGKATNHDIQLVTRFFDQSEGKENR